MSEGREKIRRRSSPRSAPVSFVCPSCKADLKADSKWCPACNFTGGDTIALFSDSPPPLLPILDAVGLWNETEIKRIETARESHRRHFPQLHWRVCAVNLPPDTRLPLFGFWLLNVCPLHENETAEERAWTVLLLIDVASGQVAAIPGYAAESCLSDDELRIILSAMATRWPSAKTADPVVDFFKSSRIQLDLSWKRNGTRRTNKFYFCGRAPRYFHTHSWQPRLGAPHAGGNHAVVKLGPL